MGYIGISHSSAFQRSYSIYSRMAVCICTKPHWQRILRESLLKDPDARDMNGHRPLILASLDALLSRLTEGIWLLCWSLQVLRRL